MRRKKNYLNNKDLLKEIHNSKLSYCDYDKSHPEYAQYDVIVENIEDIFTEETLDIARSTRALRIANENWNIAYDEAPDDDKPKLSQFKFDPATIPLKDLVFRVITWDHIKKDPERKKNPKRIADHHVKINFRPFKHYIPDLDDSSEIKDVFPLKEVLKSHTKDGEFCLTHGNLNDKLVKMLMLLVDRYGQRANWRGYTYLDEMKANALLQIVAMGLHFDEARSQNPFSYYTKLLSHSFTSVLNIEKKNQNIRDDLLIQEGISPSFTRQLEIEENIRRTREAAMSENSPD